MTNNNFYTWNLMVVFTVIPALNAKITNLAISTVCSGKVYQQLEDSATLKHFPFIALSFQTKEGQGWPGVFSVPASPVPFYLCADALSKSNRQKVIKTTCSFCSVSTQRLTVYCVLSCWERKGVQPDWPHTDCQGGAGVPSMQGRHSQDSHRGYTDLRT